MSASFAPSHSPSTDEVGGAKAIEVAAMLGDSVVDVKHCIDPRSGKISPKTWGLAAAGLSCVLLSAVAFGMSVKTAAHNKGALDYWTQVAKKPAHAYRPQTLGLGYDWLAFGGFALGVGALAGSLMRMRRERRSPYYRIGTAAGVEQPLEGAPAESFPLIAPTATGDDFVLNFGAGISGEMVIDGKSMALAELAASGRARPSTAQPGAFELPIPLGSRIRAQVGQTSFLVSGVAKPREQTTPLLAGLESRTMSYFAGSLAVHLGLVLLLAQIPVESGTVPIDTLALETVDTGGSSTEQETVTPEEEKTVGGGGSEASMAASMHLDPGQAGTDTSKNTGDSHIRIKDNNIDPVLARARAIEEARTAGVLGSVALQNGAMFADLNSASALSSGPDGVDVWGSTFGSDGEGYGTFGFGRRGFGAGCDVNCTGGGIIGTNGYGKIGLGKYGREGYAGPGGGGPHGRKRVAGVPGPVIGQPTGSGNLDKSIIRRYIKRNVDKIAYCYEKELLATPNIGGNIMVSFFISPTGSVKSSVGSGFNSTVANCVADVVGHIEFPKPSSGGGVQVNYPFTFHNAGQ